MVSLVEAACKVFAFIIAPTLLSDDPPPLHTMPPLSSPPPPQLMGQLVRPENPHHSPSNSISSPPTLSHLLFWVLGSPPPFGDVLYWALQDMPMAGCPREQLIGIRMGCRPTHRMGAPLGGRIAATVECSGAPPMCAICWKCNTSFHGLQCVCPGRVMGTPPMTQCAGDQWQGLPPVPFLCMVVKLLAWWVATAIKRCMRCS